MKSFIAAGLLLLTTIACSGPAKPVQPTPTASALSAPTATVAPALTSLPPAATPSAGSALEWDGIPIMPGAIAGEGDEEGYVFAVRATAQQVQDYYRLELPKLGWYPSSQESSDSALILIFMDAASATLTISILSKGEQSLVLLVK